MSGGGGNCTRTQDARSLFCVTTLATEISSALRVRCTAPTPDRIACRRLTRDSRPWSRLGQRSPSWNVNESSQSLLCASGKTSKRAAGYAPEYSMLALPWKSFDVGSRDANRPVEFDTAKETSAAAIRQCAVRESRPLREVDRALRSVFAIGSRSASWGSIAASR